MVSLRGNSSHDPLDFPFTGSVLRMLAYQTLTGKEASTHHGYDKNKAEATGGKRKAGLIGFI